LFNEPSPTSPDPLSLHDALPIFLLADRACDILAPPHSRRRSMTDSPTLGKPLDFASAQSLPPEQAAFFHLGPSATVAEGVVFLSAMANVSVFICEGGILLVDTAITQQAPRVVEDLRRNYSQ